jgi:hypothetical protein
MTRRRPAVAGPIPARSMPPGKRWCVASEGHLPANRRPAVPTREHQSGGQPTHAAPARHADHRARPPPANRPSLDHHQHHGRGAHAGALTLTAVPTSERHPGSGRWLSRSRIRQDGQTGPSWPLTAARRTDAPPRSHGCRRSGRRCGTRGHRRGTPDVHTRTLDSGRVDIAYADTGWSHRTPDTGHRTRGRDRVCGQATKAPAGIRTDILDHHDHPTARWDAEPWTCGRRLRRSATMTARRR